MYPFIRFSGPSRAIPILGVTQIIAWGTLFYPPVLTLPAIAAERGWSLTFTMGGFSVGLLAAGLVAPFVGSMIDRYGGHAVLPAGSLIGAAGLLALVHIENPVAYVAIWALLGAAISASLYDPAFATLGRIFGAGARRPITLLTFFGGFASTVSWPVTYFLMENGGWRGAYTAYAIVLAFFCAPFLAFTLPREKAKAGRLLDGTKLPKTKHIKAAGFAFFVVVASFAAYAFVPSALSAHMLSMFERLGLDRSTTVVMGALFGPAQVSARLCEFFFARNLHPLNIARFAIGLVIFAFVVLALLGVSAPVAFAFAILYGIANGLITLARGSVPLALFGAKGYGRTIGRIAGPSLILQAAAPLIIAFVIERFSDVAGLTLVAAVAVISLLGFLAVRKP